MRATICSLMLFLLILPVKAITGIGPVRDSAVKMIHGELLINPVVTCDSVVVIPFVRAGNLILLPAAIDSVKGNFILDTGAPGLVLNLTYFRNYRTTTHENESQAGLNSIQTSRVTTLIHKLQLDCISYQNIDADLVNLGHLENAKSVKILGLLGLELFKRFEMIIDYENNVLYLYNIPKKKKSRFRSELLKDTSSYQTLDINIVENKIITRMWVGGKRLRFIIDSGAEGNLLDSRLPNSIFDNVQVNRRVKLLGTGNEKVDALAGNLDNLRAGNMKIDNLPVMVTNLEKSCLSYINCTDGILGFDFLSLHKIGFNFVEQKMYIWK